MKIVLSRKGFDSAVGCVPSPIFPDDKMLSLPIPHASGNVTYQDIIFEGHPIAGIVSDLTKSDLRASSPAHLDPDLRAGAMPRQAGWQPLFGQDSAAQTHLERHGVGPGDIFLFFGWFRKVREVHDHWSYVPNAPDLHVLFGWLEVAEAVRIADGWKAMPRWAAGHPHFHGHSAKNNTLTCLAPSPTGASARARSTDIAQRFDCLRRVLVEAVGSCLLGSTRRNAHRP